jgi:hypothetical protein
MQTTTTAGVLVVEVTVLMVHVLYTQTCDSTSVAKHETLLGLLPRRLHTYSELPTDRKLHIRSVFETQWRTWLSVLVAQCKIPLHSFRSTRYLPKLDFFN